MLQQAEISTHTETRCSWSLSRSLFDLLPSFHFNFCLKALHLHLFFISWHQPSEKWHLLQNTKTKKNKIPPMVILPFSVPRFSNSHSTFLIISFSTLTCFAFQKRQAYVYSSWQCQDCVRASISMHHQQCRKWFDSIGSGSIDLQCWQHDIVDRGVFKCHQLSHSSWTDGGAEGRPQELHSFSALDEEPVSLKPYTIHELLHSNS